MDLVTIILTTLNSEKFVARSIESCLNQTYPELELIVVDGGSQDRTLEIVQSYDDPRLCVIHQPENSGKLPGAINLGMENAHGRYITWTQDDSWYEPNTIETLLTYLETYPEIALVYADFWVVDENSNRLQYRSVNTPEHILEEDVVGQCFLFHRRVYEVIGPQDIQHFPVHEVPWRIKVNNKFRIAPLHKALMYWTLHPDSLTGRYGPWAVHYMMLETLRQEGLLDRYAYARQLAQTHIHNAYEEFVLNGNYCRFWQHVVAGLRYDITHLENHGLCTLVLMSLLPSRDKYRAKLYRTWKTDLEARHMQLIQASAPR